MKSRFESLLGRCLPLLLALGPAPLLAQSSGLHFGVDPISFFGSGSQEGGVPIGTARYTHRFESDFDTLPGDISSHELSFFAPLLPLSYDRLRLIAAASYRVNWFDTSAPLLLPDDTLHAVRLPVVGLFDISDKWIVGGMVMPGYSGDGSEFDDGFSLLSGLVLGYSPSDRFKVFAGGVYSHGFDEDIVFPGVGFMWKPTDDLSVNLLPPWATISYRYGEDWIFSLFGRYDSATWNVEPDSTGPARDINIRELRAGLRVERQLANRIWLNLAGGVSLARRMEIETTGSTSLQEDDIDPGAFVQAGLNFRY